MTHLPNLIQDLGLILMAAAVMTLLFKQLKQPIVLGYLIAGFLVSPYVPFLPTVQDEESIKIWAEIGVIFMLFGLGLEFSFKRLAQVGKTAAITATFEIVFMLLIGFIVGRALNWSSMDCLFLGAILSMSSTTIIVKAFDELKLKRKSFASVVFGVLIVEDLIAILLLVVLASIGTTQSLSGTELLTSLIRLVFFIVLWFVLGIFLLPLLLRICRHLLSDEILLLVSVGLCLMMVVIATKVGFSPALGAFVMGSLLAETSKGSRIEHLVLPVKDLFSAVFFVSVGMMIDPLVLYEQFGVVALITGVTIIGKFLGTGIGALVSGRDVKSCVQSGMSMAQIGEFSFIIATLGVTLGVISDMLYPIAVAVSAITTFTTPYLIRASDGVSDRLTARIPGRIRKALTRYEDAMTIRTSENVLSLLWREHGVKIVLNSVIVIGIVFAADRVRLHLTGHFGVGEVRLLGVDLSGIAGCFASLLLSAPFLRAVFRTALPRQDAYGAETLARLLQLQIGVSITRFLIGSLLLGFIVAKFTSMLAFSGIFALSLAGLLLFLFSRFFEPIYLKIENRFVSHLTGKERAIIEERARLPHLAPWEAALTEYTLSEFSPLVMKTVHESRIKDDYGLTIVLIKRGETDIVAPKSGERLIPCDKIYLIGTSDQLGAIRETIEKRPDSEEMPEFDDANFGLVPFLLTEGHPLIGKTIRDSGLRESADALIVGVERKGKRYLNPDPDMALEHDDMLWLFGDRAKLRNIL